MSTLSIAPQVATTGSSTTSGRASTSRHLRSVPSFDFTAPVEAIGFEPAAREAVPVAPEAPTVPVALVPAQRRPVGVAPLAPVARHAVRPARAAVRLTRRGRALVTLTFVGIAVAALVTLGGGWAVASLGGGTAEPVRTVQVQPGDTLYDIASDVAAPGHVREMVYEIKALNDLPSSTISEGQKLAVPRG